MKVTRTTERLANLLYLTAEMTGQATENQVSNSSEEALVFGGGHPSNELSIWTQMPPAKKPLFDPRE